MKNQKKLVETFKAFMEKGVIPFLPEDHIILNQWRFLSGILTLEPIDQNQIDFYLLMANKNPQQKSSSSSRGPSQVQNRPKEQQNTSKAASNEQHSNLSNKQQKINTKKLLANMQSFQGLMVKNQEKLQNIAKKDINAGKGDGSINTSIQGKKNG